MSRDIRFRAWSEKEGLMINIRLNHFADFLCNSQDFKIMQYTGLRDKEGRPIYEGDIVFVSKGNDRCLYEVYYSELETAFKFTSMSKNPISLSNPSKEIIEVFTNIYEHPELLYFK